LLWGSNTSDRFTSSSKELLALRVQQLSQNPAFSLGVHVELFLLEVWWDALHDLLSLGRVVNLKGVQILGGSELELGDRVSLVLLDSDLLGLGQVLALSSHDLDELLQVLNFLGLQNQNFRNLPCFKP
jgi:hypothetical protein